MRRLSFLFGSLTLLPLIVAGLTVLAVSHFSWRSMLVFLATLVATAANQLWVPHSDLNMSVNELLGFKEQFPGLTFRSIPVSEYVTALREQVPHLRSKRSEEILPFSARAQQGRLRILVRSSAQECLAEAVPQAWVTYASFLGAWMIVPDPPERLQPLGFFLFLHEIGHTAFASFATRLASKFALRNMIFSGVFLALLIAPSLNEGAALLVLALSWLLVAAGGQRFHRTRARIDDEICADLFALERSNPEWFRRFPVSEIISRMAKKEHRFETTPDDEIRQRTIAFSENLDRLIHGQKLKTSRELLPDYRWGLVGEILLMSLLVLAGVSHGPLSSGRLWMLWAFSLLLGAVGLVATLMQVLQRNLLDHVFGVKQASPEELKFLKGVGERQQKNRKLWSRITRSPL